MAKRIVNVTFSVEVETNDRKFTKKFMEEFRGQFYKFYTIGEHVEHIAQLAARDLLSQEFTEGYGPLADFGIKARVLDCDCEVD